MFKMLLDQIRLFIQQNFMWLSSITPSQNISAKEICISDEERVLFIWDLKF